MIYAVYHFELFCGVIDRVRQNQRKKGIWSLAYCIWCQQRHFHLETGKSRSLPNAKVFWTVNKKHYPNLSVIALRVLNIAASTASNECAFSVESFIRNKYHNRLSTEKTSKLMIVKENIKILPFTADGEAVKNFYKTFTEEEE